MAQDTTIAKNGKLKISEIAGHAVAGIGQNLIFGLWSSYMLVFFTDVFGIGGGLSGFVLTASKYQPNTIQSGGTLSAFHTSITLLVGLSMLLGIVPMLFNDFNEKKYAEISAELALRRAARS